MANLSLVFDLIARDRASNTLNQAGESAGKVGKALGAIGAIAGGLALGSVFAGFIEGAESGARIGRISEQIIKQTGSAAGVTADHVADLADAIERKTGADGDAIQSGENVLLTFTNVRNEVGKGNDIFDQTVGIATDMATVLGGDASSAATQLGKALNDPIKGITALSKAGVSFTDQQKDQIKTLVQSGNQLGAQKVILAELTKEFGGAAEAAATPLDRLRARVGQLGEGLASNLLPVIDKAVSFLDRNSQSFDQFGASIAGVAGPIGTLVSTGAAVAGFLKRNNELLVIAGSVLAAVYAPGVALAAAATASLVATQVASFFTSITTGAATSGAAFAALGTSIGVATLGIGLAIGTLVKGFADSRAEAEKTRKTFEDLSHAGSPEEYAKNRAELQKLANTSAILNPTVRQTRVELQAATNAAKQAPAAITALDASYAKVNLTVEQLAGGFGVSADQIRKLAEAANVDLGSTSFDKAYVAISNYQASTVTAKTGAQVLATANGVLADKTASAADKTKALDDAINSLFGTQLSAEAAADGFAGKINDLTATLKENKDQIDGNSSSALANREALRGVTQSFLDNIAAARNNGASQDELSAKFDQGVASFRAAATAAGLTAAQVNDLANKYGLIPANKSTVIGISGVDAAVAGAVKVRTSIDNIQSKTVTITTQLRSEDFRGPRPGFTAPPGFAVGTFSAPGGVALVGERGPELVNLPTGAKVHTANQTASMLGARPESAVFHIYDTNNVLLGTIDGRIDHADAQLSTTTSYS